MTERRSLQEKLAFLYPDRADEAMHKIEKILEKYRDTAYTVKPQVDEQDVMLITYGDSIRKEGEAPLETLHRFLTAYAPDTVSAVHLLPMFPYTSDDGFSVVDYRQIDPALGTWDDVHRLSEDYDLMFDAVINHSSKSCAWFQEFLKGNPRYAQYYIVCDKDADYSKVTRPRALPLLTAFDTAGGVQYLWTTFSEDQVDLNFANPDVLAEIADILLFYAVNGARFIRLDAIGFAWKKAGTTCMHLEETHTVVKILRQVLDTCAKGCTIITETNVPHKDNISYFGNGHDEAKLVYQFPLPPLTLFSYHSGSVKKLADWAAGLESATPDTLFFNFLASHDGIGMRPTDGILTAEEKQLLVDKCLLHGGRVSYKDNGDGTKSPYELNINYQDALTHPDESEERRAKKFLGAQTILLTLAGMPGIYIHSFLGSRNDIDGVNISGINRRINREKLDYDRLTAELSSDTPRKAVFDAYCERIRIRRCHSAFSPLARQTILSLDERVFAVLRHNEQTGERVLALINVADESVTLETGMSGVDLLTGQPVPLCSVLAPYDSCWIQVE